MSGIGNLGGSDSKTTSRDDHSDRRVAASEGSLAVALQGRGRVQTGGLVAYGRGQLVTGGYVLGRGASLSIYNEAPAQTAAGLLENYVKGQADGGPGNAIPDSPGAAAAPPPFDLGTL